MSKFPSGRHFHRNHGLMRNIRKGKVTPEIFHMSWTTNKLEKRDDFLEQMGEWYVKMECIVKRARNMMEFDSNNIAQIIEKES